MSARPKRRLPLPTPTGNLTQVLELYESIQRSHAKLAGGDGKVHKLPVSLTDFLTKLNDRLSQGESVAIVQDDAQLTTVEAARMLGVSRQFLVNLLKRGSLPHHMTGSHRRIYVRDLVAYKARRDSRRRCVLDDLTRAEAADGLYDLELPDDRAR